MAYTFVGVTKVQSSTGSSAAATVTSSNGNALFCCGSAYCGTTTGSGLAVSGSGTWTVDTTVTDVNDTANKFKGFIASCPNTIGGANTVTVSNGVASGCTAFVYEFSGNVLTAIRDATSPAVAAGTGTTATTGSLTNVTANALFVGCMVDASGANPATVTGTSSGWVYPAGGKETNGATFQVMGSGYKVVSATGAETSAWTINSIRWDALIAVYAAAGGAAVPSMAGWFQQQQVPRPPLVVTPY